MSLQQRLQDDAFQTSLAERLSRDFGPSRAPGAPAVGGSMQPGTQQRREMAPLPPGKSLTEQIQQTKNTYDKGKKIYDYGSKAAHSLGDLINPAATPTQPVGEGLGAFPAAPAGATQPVGEGMGAFPTSAFSSAAPGAAEAAPTAAAPGAAAIAAPVAAGMYGMKRYNDLGYGNGLQDFYTGDWTNNLMKDSHFTDGLSDSAKKGADVAMDAGKLFTEGQGTNPMNPMTWLKWGKDIGDIFGF